MKEIDYGGIIKRSWEVTRKSKWLWVLGLVLAIFGGGSGSGGGSGGSSGFDIPTSSPSPSTPPSDINNLQSFGSQATKVLGTATNGVKDWFSNFPIHNWLLLGLTLLIFVAFSVFVVWIMTSWAKGSLIGGFEDADAGKDTNLKTVSPYGFAKIKDLIIFRLIAMGITIGIIVNILAVVGIGFIVKAAIPTLGIIWMVLFGIVGTLLFVVVMILFAMLNVYAERLIVLRNYSPWEAWKKGLSLGKGNFFPTLIMGIINSAIGCATGCVTLVVFAIVLGLPGFFLIYPSFKDGFRVPAWGNIFGLVILLVLFISINFLIKAILVVFNYGNWNLFFRQIMGKKVENGN